MTPAAVGFLVRPIKSLGEKGTSWIVDWGIDQPMGYNRVGATHTDPCNLQVGAIVSVPVCRLLLV